MKNSPKPAKSNNGQPPSKPKSYVVQTWACGMSVQRQWPAMLADCAQIFIWVSVY